MRSYKRFFITKFVICVTKFVTRIRKFVTSVTKFVTKIPRQIVKIFKGAVKNSSGLVKNCSGLVKNICPKSFGADHYMPPPPSVEAFFNTRVIGEAGKTAQNIR